MNKKPLVSVVIPVFNGSNFLREAIDSVLSQTYANIEILVINDGSKDENKTEKIALSYGDRITYISKENGGVSSALNLGINKMQGDFFSWLSHDDVFFPSKTEDQINYFLNNINARIIFSDVQLVDSIGNNLARDVGIKENARLNFFYQLLSFYPINGCTTLIHKSVFNEIGGFNGDLSTTQDYDIWFRIAKKYSFDYFDIKVLKSRIHDEQNSVTNSVMRYECDELYTRIARYTICNRETTNITDIELFNSAKSLAKRGYYSSSLMAVKGVKHLDLQFKFYTFFTFNLFSFLIIKYLVHIKNNVLNLKKFSFYKR